MRNKDVYEKVNKKILDLMAEGTMPWEMTWSQAGNSLPMNVSTKKAYRGINIWLLGLTAISEKYTQNQWVTYKQALDMGGNVKRGEKSKTFVIFAKMIDKKGQEDIPKEDREHFFLYKTKSVFNIDQCEGIEIEASKQTENDPIQEAEKLVAGYINKPTIVHGPYDPAYSPRRDEVMIPDMKGFDGSEEYYSALFHELAHSTGHKSRMDRGLDTSFGSELYSKEEMIAEFTASYLMAVTGIEKKTVENSASYIENWSQKIQKDPKIIMNSASIAMKVAEYIQGVAK